MMEDLFSTDLNLDLGVDDTNDLDFLPEDLFNFIDDDLHEDLKEIAENDMIPNIESLINFDEDDQLDDMQWDDDLDTTDFFKNVQIPAVVSTTSEQQQNPQQKATNLLKNHNSKTNDCDVKCNSSKSKQNKQTKSTTKKDKHRTNYVNVHDHLLSPSSTSPNSPGISSSNESSSNDSSDFLDMFQNYYSLNSDNQLISHPISSLSNDEIDKLTYSFHQQPYSFDLSNNFGGFVNMQSALSLVNGAQQSSIPTLVTNNSKQLSRRKKSKGISLLAHKPKSYKTIKKEMLQKKSLLNNKQLTNRLKTELTESTTTFSRTTFESTNSMQILPIETENSIIDEQIFDEQFLGGDHFISGQILNEHNNDQQIQLFPTTITTSTYAQDHDYCFGIIDDSSHS